MSIYAMRSKSVSQANTKIEHKGFEISIAFDDRHRGGHLTRASIIVYKGDEDVTRKVGANIEERRVTEEGIIDPKGEDLVEIMRAIDALEPTRKTDDLGGALSDIVQGARRM